MSHAASSREPESAGARVHLFGGSLRAGETAPRDEVGSKAFHLMRLAAAGIPVPPAFVIGTEHCRRYYRNGGRLPTRFDELLIANVRGLERISGRAYGSSRRPLLVSVRSGAANSMPGMMQTVLNIGLTDATVSGLLRMTGNPRLAWDSYRRLIESFAVVVHGCAREPFAQLLADSMSSAGVPSASELDVAALKALAVGYKRLFEACTGHDFPQDPTDQLTRAAEAVFRSWGSPQARRYRTLHGLSDESGTAITIQSMVFGNMGGTSGSGVGFTRDPATGEDELYVDFVFDAQGEDVVSGRRIAQDADSLAVLQPDLWRQLQELRRQLEHLFRDMQDFEFTIQEGELFVLQSRRAKRTPRAALRVAVDLVREGIIDEAEGLQRLSTLDLDSIVIHRLAGEGADVPLAAGVPASPGVASGAIALDSDSAEQLAGSDQPAILVRQDTSTSDLPGMVAATGFLTAIGSRTSHAAVVARQLGKVVVGCRELVIDLANRRCAVGAHQLDEGDVISLDGTAGSVFAGRIDVVAERPEAELAVVREWTKGTMADR